MTRLIFIYFSSLQELTAANAIYRGPRRVERKNALKTEAHANSPAIEVSLLLLLLLFLLLLLLPLLVLFFDLSFKLKFYSFS